MDSLSLHLKKTESFYTQYITGNGKTYFHQKPYETKVIEIPFIIKIYSLWVLYKTYNIRYLQKPHLDLQKAIISAIHDFNFNTILICDLIQNPLEFSLYQDNLLRPVTLSDHLLKAGYIKKKV